MLVPLPKAVLLPRRQFPEFSVPCTGAACPCEIKLQPGLGLVADCSVLKRNADEIALPPDHAALANGVKIVEAQFEIQRQRIEGVKFDSGPGICDVLNAAGEDAALRVKEQPRVFRDRRPRHVSAFEFHRRYQPFMPGLRWQRLANCAQAPIRLRLIRKQSILMIPESRIPRARVAVVWTMALRLDHSAACSASGTHNRA
jgi:hypothetical protein